MGFLRNPDVKKSVILYIMVTIVAIGFSFFLDVRFGGITVCICILFDTIFIITTYKRYQKIAKFSREVELILHGKEHINLSEYAEGELSILQSVVAKMTIHLRGQAEMHEKDKRYLADSIADISHQIRTPLTSIHLIVSLLSQVDLPRERRMELTKELSKLLMRIDWLINSLLKISRLDTGTADFKKEVVSVAKLIDMASLPILISLELREQTLEVEMTGKETYLGDLSWSMEAVGNILKNSMEHTPKGGKITITAEENAIYTEIIISDNGFGIDKQDLAHLFERFYKGKNAGEQSIGIGLALSRMIVLNQNGTLKAENNPEGGARFILRFYKGVV